MNSLTDTFFRLAEIEANQAATAKQAALDNKVLNKAEQATNFFIQFIPENSNSTAPIVRKMQNAILDDQKAKAPCLIVFPGIEGVLYLLEKFAEKVKADVYGVEYAYQTSNVSIEESADQIFKVN